MPYVQKSRVLTSYEFGMNWLIVLVDLSSSQRSSKFVVAVMTSMKEHGYELC